MAGVAWASCILTVKVLGDDGGGTDASVAQGIIYAADQGARVINLSLSSGSQTLRSAVAYARGKGSEVVAAGNDNSLQLRPTAPASPSPRPALPSSPPTVRG